MKQLLSKLFFFLLLVPVSLFAQRTAILEEQDITGLWKGSLYNDTTKKFLPYELAISEDNGKLTGYSYTLFDIDGKKELGVKKIKLTRKNDELTIEDITLISNTYSEPPPKKVRQQSILNLLLKDTAMELAGKWSTNKTREYLPLTGSMQLVKKIEYRPEVLFQKLVELNLDKDLSFVKAENEKQVAIARKQIAITEKTPPAATPLPPPVVTTIAAPVIQVNTAVVVENIIPEKMQKVSVQRISTPAVPKKIKLPALGKKKEVLIAANYRKKEVVEPVIVKAEPVVAKPPAKKLVVTEKPATVVAPVKKNIPPPVATVKEPVKTPAVVVPPPAAKPPVTTFAPISSGAAAEVSERKINKEQFVYFDSDSLVLTLYDNGDVDGDTVSVLMNGQIIFAKQGLSTKANSKTVYIDKATTDSLSMIMYAENLGSIPPNTGLMIIMDGEKRYEVRFSADLKTNAAILLRRRKTE